MENWLNPPQPFDPFADAAAEYCHLRHRDTPEGDKCKEMGQCPRCQETVRVIVRTWLSASLTP